MLTTLLSRASGLRVSEYALGTGRFGKVLPNGIDAEHASEVFQAYVDAGGFFLDTAAGYQAGESERLIGAFVGSRRDDFVISTKWGIGVTRDEHTSLRGNTRKAILASIDGSLRRLGTDYVDIYSPHGDDVVTPIEETLSALDDLIRAGKVRYGGLGNYPAWRIARADLLADIRSYAPITAVTFEYGLAERTPERDLIPMAEALGIGIMPWSALGGGFLADYPRTASGLYHWGAQNRPDDRDRSVQQAIFGVARDLGVRPAVVGLAWMRQHLPAPAHRVVPILGGTKKEQLVEVLESHVVLSDVHMRLLDEASAPTLGEPNDHNEISLPLLSSGFGSGSLAPRA